MLQRQFKDYLERGKGAALGGTGTYNIPLALDLMCIDIHSSYMFVIIHTTQCYVAMRNAHLLTHTHIAC